MNKIYKITYKENINNLSPSLQQSITEISNSNFQKPLYFYFNEQKPEINYLIFEKNENTYNLYKIDKKNNLINFQKELNKFEKTEKDIIFEINKNSNNKNYNITDITKNKSIEDFSINEKILLLTNIKTQEYYPEIKNLWNLIHPKNKEYEYEIRPDFIENVMKKNPEKFNLNNPGINTILNKAKNEKYLEKIKEIIYKTSLEPEKMTDKLAIIIEYKNKDKLFSKIEKNITSIEESQNCLDYLTKNASANFYNATIIEFDNENVEIKNKTNEENISLLNNENRKKDIINQIPYFDNYENKKEIFNKLNFLLNDLQEKNYIVGFNKTSKDFLLFDITNKSIETNLSFNKIIEKGIESMKYITKYIPKKNTKERNNNIKLFEKINKKDLSKQHVSTNKNSNINNENKRLNEDLKKAHEEIDKLKQFNETLIKISEKDQSIFQNYNLAQIFKGLNKEEINDCWKKTKIYADSIRESHINNHNVETKTKSHTK